MKCPNCGYCFCCCREEPKIIRDISIPKKPYNPHIVDTTTYEYVERADELEAFSRQKKQDFEEESLNSSPNGSMDNFSPTT